MRKIAIAATVVMTLAVGVVGYAAMQPRPAHCARTAAMKAAKEAKRDLGVQIVSAVDRGQHHHHGAPGEVTLMQNVIDPIPECFPCPPDQSGCDCSLWDQFWHCSLFMN